MIWIGVLGRELILARFFVKLVVLHRVGVVLAVLLRLLCYLQLVDMALDGEQPQSKRLVSIENADRAISLDAGGEEEGDAIGVINFEKELPANNLRL